ncbi:MAG: hypothetical protein RSF67_04125 [Clostridia bacterium]
MSTLTANYKLIKPDVTDTVDINNFNSNFDTIDINLFNKVEKVDGKGLSTNDYTNEEKQKVGTIANKVDKVEGKVLSSNDYTNDEKQKLNSLANYIHPETHLASMIVFSDGETLQEKFDNNTLFTPVDPAPGV